MPHGAPAKTLRRNVLELTTSRPLTCKIVGENRSRPRPDETSVREMDAYVRDPKFPDTRKKFPVPCNIFPVNLRRELREKRLRRSGFCYEIGPGSPEIAKFPVKF